MPELVWEDVAWWFDPRRWGVLPDGEVAGTSPGDWQRLLDLIGQEAWASEYVVDGEVRNLPGSVADLFDPAVETAATIKVWPATGVQVNLFVHTPARIDFDVDLRELQGQDRLDTLCSFIRTLGRTVGKPVELMAEGATAAESALAYDPARDRIIWLAEDQ